MVLALGIYYFLLISISVLGLYQWRLFGRAEKIIVILVATTLVAEAFALYASYKWRNNLPVYHLFSPIEFLLISLYFNYSIKSFRTRHIGLAAGAVGILISLVNTCYFQKATTINSYFLLFEGTSVIIYALLSFHQILLDEEHLPYPFAQFWITICFLIYWSATFTGWGIYAMLDQKEFVLNPIFRKVLAAANYAFYLGIGAIFLRYKKLIPSGA